MDKSQALVPAITSEEMDAIAQYYDTSRIDTVDRKPKRINNAIHDVFDLMGGVPRMTLWADKNPTDFYTKVLPRVIQTSQHQEHSGRIEIVSKIPYSPLDGEYEDVTPTP